MTTVQVFPQPEEIWIFFEQVVKDCQEAGLTIQKAFFDFNSRLKRTLGRCSKYDQDPKNQQYFLIEISSYLLKTQNPALLRDVIAHELIHTIPGCDNHGPAFKKAAKKLNAYFPGVYNVQVKANLADYGLEAPKTNHYKIVCQDCHYTMYRQRMSKFLRQIDCYQCPKCHGPLKVYRVRYVF